MDAATAALDQPGGEGEAYGKAKADWQPRFCTRSRSSPRRRGPSFCQVIKACCGRRWIPAFRLRQGFGGHVAGM